ncbi:EscI/YscI/HrpB family type III secretion system inner rod protein [Massilia oculi]|jgi:hypothetical protein|nr:EscI/YscI/HrpB family type III secretion system inner rod protein [Massilia oculi]
MINQSMPVDPTGTTSRLHETAPVRIDPVVVDDGDAAAFRAAMAQHARAAGVAPDLGNASGRVALGEQIMGRASTLAEEIQGDQQYVSKLLETATRSGDSMHLMKAMMAMHDYQTRVQFVSKVVSKAATSVDQLTKLQ